MLTPVSSVAPPSVRTALLDRLIEAGLGRAVAQDLLERFPAASIDRQLRALPYRKARNPAMCLQSAIRGEWALPREMVRAKMSASTTSGAGAADYWKHLDQIADAVAASASLHPQAMELELYALDLARQLYPNQIGNDGRDMDGMESAVRAIVAFELGYIDELRTCLGTFGPDRRRFGPAPLPTRAMPTDERPVGPEPARSDTPAGSGKVAGRQEAML